MSEPIISAKDLRKTYRVRTGVLSRTEFHAIDGVSLDVMRGETLAVVGESGAGKSTLGLLLLRLLDPDGGSIVIDGTDLRSLDRRALRSWRRHAQMVFQNPFGSFDPRATIARSLAEPLRLHRSDLTRAQHDEIIVGLLDRVGIGADVLDRFPHEFSGGQLQRLAIARALTTDPALIVCDEPVAALDMSIRAQVVNLLQDIREERGLTLVFISHDLSLVRVIADRIAVMYAGRVMELGASDVLYERPRHPYTQALIAAVPVPDPVIQRSRPAIELGSADLAASAGCPFAPRCPLAIERCRVEVPALRDVDGRSVACHLAEAG